jgi:hypothetical protein
VNRLAGLRAQQNGFAVMAKAFESFCKVAAILIYISVVPTSHPASFDCSKASRPIERLICNDPLINRLDAEMGLNYRQANAAFPLRGFVLATQRIFIRGYEHCLNKVLNQPKNSSTVTECLTLLNERIVELQDYGPAKVYTNAESKSVTPEDLIILVHDREKKRRIRFWGNWMPDAYRPGPFPEGKLCDLSEEVESSTGGFRSNTIGDVLIKVTETEVTVDGFISCTPRNGIEARAYRRVR